MVYNTDVVWCVTAPHKTGEQPKLHFEDFRSNNKTFFSFSLFVGSGHRWWCDVCSSDFTVGHWWHREKKIKSNSRQTSAKKIMVSVVSTNTRPWFIVCDFSNVGYKRFRAILNSIVPYKVRWQTMISFPRTKHSLLNFLLGAFVSIHMKFVSHNFRCHCNVMAVTVVALTAPNQLITAPIRSFSSLSCSTPSSTQ